MEAQLIKHSFLGKGELLKTDLDFFFNQIEDGKLDILSFLGPTNATEKKWFQDLDLEGSQEQHTFVPHFVDKLDITPGKVSVEMVNFTLSLVVLSIQYASLFWNRNKPFALLFSLHQLSASGVSLITLSSFHILYKIHIVRPQVYFLRSSHRFALSLHQTIGLSLLIILLMTLSSFVLFLYGSRKFQEWKGRQVIKSTIGHFLSWSSFLPHLGSLFCFTLLFSSSLPIMYDLVLIYCGSFDSAPLIGASALALFLLGYILLWLFLTLKQSWDFSATCDNSVILPSQNGGYPQSIFGPVRHITQTPLPYPPSEVDSSGIGSSKYSAIAPSLLRSDHGLAGHGKALSSVALSSEKHLNRLSMRRNSCYFPRGRPVADEEQSTFGDSGCDEDRYGTLRHDNKSRKSKRWSLRASRKEKKTSRKEETGSEEERKALTTNEDERRQEMEEKTFSPSHDHRMNGDYELLVETNPEDIYGIRTLFSPPSLPVTHTLINDHYHPMTAMLRDHHPQESESDSSGVHSSSSPENSINDGGQLRKSFIGSNLGHSFAGRRTTSFPRKDLKIPVVHSAENDDSNSPFISDDLPPPVRDVRVAQMTSFASPQAESLPPPPDDLVSEIEVPTFRTERFRSESEFAMELRRAFLS